MKCDEVHPLLLDYEEGRLAPADMEAVRRHLETCADCARERAELREIALVLRTAPRPEPGPRVRATFQAWLDAEQEEMARTCAEKRNIVPLPWMMRQAWIGPALSALAACAIFAAGIFIGGRTGNAATAAREEATAHEIERLRQQMNSMGQVVAWSLVEKGTASDRLKTVLAMSTQSGNDGQTIDALLAALAFDTSSSVRSGAVEALRSHAGQAPVRAAVASALPREQSPVVQLAMIDLLASTRQPDAASALERFSLNQTQAPAVRDAARLALASM